MRIPLRPTYPDTSTGRCIPSHKSSMSSAHYSPKFTRGWLYVPCGSGRGIGAEEIDSKRIISISISGIAHQVASGSGDQGDVDVQRIAASKTSGQSRRMLPLDPESHPSRSRNQEKSPHQILWAWATARQACDNSEKGRRARAEALVALQHSLAHA